MVPNEKPMDATALRCGGRAARSAGKARLVGPRRSMKRGSWWNVGTGGPSSGLALLVSLAACTGEIGAPTMGAPPQPSGTSGTTGGPGTTGGTTGPGATGGATTGGMPGTPSSLLG